MQARHGVCRCQLRADASIDGGFILSNAGNTSLWFNLRPARFRRDTSVTLTVTDSHGLIEQLCDNRHRG